MKVKVILGIVVLFIISVGTYTYQNRYSFYRYLPAKDEFKLQNINSKLYDENNKIFSGRVKSGSDSYLNIYSYKDGELDGLNVIYFKNNIKEIGHWKKGKQNGLFQLYTEDGILIDNANFKNGERDGLTEQYYGDTGNLRVSANYKNGILEGKFKAYYPNGNLQGEVIYKNGEMNGEFKEYHENKNIRLSGSYKNNLQDGEWKSYLEDGTLESIINYKDGQVIEEQRFNRDGTPETITINGTINSDEITIKEVSDDEIIISESSEDFSKELEIGNTLSINSEKMENKDSMIQYNNKFGIEVNGTYFPIPSALKEFINNGWKISDKKPYFLNPLVGEDYYNMRTNWSLSKDKKSILKGGKIIRLLEKDGVLLEVTIANQNILENDSPTQAIEEGIINSMIIFYNETCDSIKLNNKELKNLTPDILIKDFPLSDGWQHIPTNYSNHPELEISSEYTTMKIMDNNEISITIYFNLENRAFKIEVSNQNF